MGCPKTQQSSTLRELKIEQVTLEKSQMNKITIRQTALPILLLSFMGMTTTAYGANKKFSEGDACGMAKTEILNRQGGESKRELNVLNCTKFSLLDIGAANIHVVYDTSYYNAYLKTRYETKNLTDKCSFLKTSDGWKLVSCK